MAARGGDGGFPRKGKDAAGPEGAQPEKPKVPPRQVSNEAFDHERYISEYTGHTRIERLLFIADHCAAIEVEALNLALDAIKQSTNTRLFHEVSTRLQGLVGTAHTIDEQWVVATDKKCTQQQEKLETELHGYRNNLIRESVRMGFNDLGNFFYERGDLQSSFKNYFRGHEYCATTKHQLAMILNIIRVSMETGNWPAVHSYVKRATSMSDWDDSVYSSKLKCALGLAALENGNFKTAARSFLECTFDIGNSFNDVILPRDIATYGGLCALAAFDRGDLKRKVIDNVQFKQFLELAPEIRELILDFYHSRYSSCLTYLARMKDNLLFDIHLHVHVDRLYAEVRKKALVQYFSPFISVDLNRMASSFNTDVAAIEKEVAQLIMDGQIAARIDSHNKVLYARTDDERVATFSRALAVGRDYQLGSKALILRVNLMRADFVIRGVADHDRFGGGRAGGAFGMYGFGGSISGKRTLEDS